MATTIDSKTDEFPGVNRAGMERRGQTGHVAAQQDSFDYATWLSEYRRWTRKGSCATARRGDIEWGGEGSN